MLVIFIYTKEGKSPKMKEKKTETNLTVLDMQILKNHQIEICIAHQSLHNIKIHQNEECTTKY